MTCLRWTFNGSIDGGSDEDGGVKSVISCVVCSDNGCDNDRRNSMINSM
jgi:hypothetical protein